MNTLDTYYQFLNTFAENLEMNKRLEVIVKKIKVSRQELNKHSLYNSLKTIEDIQTFTEMHVFAVWDFMSLLKALQVELTCIQTPWIPKSNVTLSRFVNEIVHGEESDLNELGEAKSHFEMYLDAMNELGADCTEINLFIDKIRNGNNIYSCIDSLLIDERVKDFLNYTFTLIDSNEPHLIASSFTFGREDVIPDMFMGILNGVDPENVSYPKFKYYLERHVELDGDEHGPISLQMVEQLCGDSDRKWEEALIVAEESLKRRIALWDAIEEVIKELSIRSILN